MSVIDVMGLRLVTAAPDETVQAAIRRMLDENVGSVAVCEETRLLGIFTERDVLRLAGNGARFDALELEQVMTRCPVTISADDDIAAAARLMRDRGIRHLPVVHGENLVGVVGIRDILGALTEEVWRTHDPDARETVHELLSRVRRERQQ